MLKDVIACCCMMLCYQVLLQAISGFTVMFEQCEGCCKPSSWHSLGKQGAAEIPASTALG
jgi:hypothetical protein